MTKEEKQLLFQDLSARLPYHVRCKIWLKDGTTEEGPLDLEYNYADVLLNVFYYNKIKNIKPYLRPMSSMTDGEKEELTEEHKKDERIYIEIIERVANGDESARGTAVPHFAADWCNEHHFDHRGLIERGLAIEAPEGMYNIN